MRVCLCVAYVHARIHTRCTLFERGSRCLGCSFVSGYKNGKEKEKKEEEGEEEEFFFIFQRVMCV